MFVCILQGAIFALLLFWRWVKKRNLADFWLGALLLLMCSALVTHFVGFAGLYDADQNWTFFPFEIVFATAPAIYLYVVNLTDARRGWRTRDLLFFVPTAVYLSYRLWLYSQDLAFKDWYNANVQDPFATALEEVLLFGWNFAFLYFSIKHYRKYRRWLDDNFSDTELVKFNWLKNFLYLFAVVFVCDAAFELTNSFLLRLSYIQFYYLNLIIAFLTYYLAIAGFLRSETITVNFSPAAETVSVPAEELGIAARTNSLANEEFDKLKNKLQKAMREERLFLDSQITLQDLSKRIGVNTTVLSRVINSGFGKNFNDFINEFRVNAVIEKLNLEDSSNQTLLGAAFDCGFNSKATFNRAFKKIKGVSPTEFFEQTEKSENVGQDII